MIQNDDNNGGESLGIEAKVSVLMPVYNGEKYIKEAMESILTQTFSDFEFLVLDDGSTDKSIDIASNYTDPRIRLIKNGKNLGVAKTLNKGLRLARGRYIARMDCDDISLPARLERQVEFMDRNPHIGVSGTWIKKIDDEKGAIWSPPLTHNEIVCHQLFEPALAHPTVIMRKSVFTECGLEYDSSYSHAQDYDLWVRASGHTQLGNVGEVLLFYRVHMDQISERFLKRQFTAATRVRKMQLESMGVKVTKDDLDIHMCLSLIKLERDKKFLKQAEKWLSLLRKNNLQRHFFPEPVFSLYLAKRWFMVCQAASSLGLWTFLMFIVSPLGRDRRIELNRKLDLARRCWHLR